MPSEDYLRAAVAVAKTVIAEHEAPDRAPDDPREWLRCLDCGELFMDDRDFLTHVAWGADE